MEQLRQEIRNDLEQIRKAKMRNEFGIKVVAFILGASILLNGLIIWSYWRANGTPVVVYNDLPLKVSDKTVKRGERLGYTVDFCKNRDIEGSVVRTLLYVNGGVIAEEASSATAQTIGCRKITAFSYEIPANAPLGKAKLQVVTQYRTSVLKPQTYRVFTEEFEIVEQE